jgi:integrase
MQARLNDKTAAKAPPGLYWDTHDTAPRGFLLRVTTGGSRTWCLNYRVRDTGKERRLTVGDVASWPVTAARRRAAELRRVIDAGGDPLGAWQEKRQAPTVKELVDRFVDEGLPRRAPKTQEEYRAMLDGYIVPAFGAKQVAAVERADIERLHRRITEAGKPSRANGVLRVVHLLFEQAIAWSMRPDGSNPARRVKANREEPRERFLSDAEIARLMAALEQWRAGNEHDSAERRAGKHDTADLITLLLLTGARRGEVVGMRWGQLDLDAAVWSKPMPLTKQRKPHRTPVSPEAAELLRRRLAEHEAACEQSRVVSLVKDDRVFRGSGVVDRLERDWRVIRASAGLDGVRLHDLRHSYASLLVGAGLSLPIIGALLGHSQAQTTKGMPI